MVPNSPEAGVHASGCRTGSLLGSLPSAHFPQAPPAQLTALQVGLDLRRVLAKDALNLAVEVRVAVVDVVNVLR